MIEWIKILGSILGAIAFLWQVWRVWKSYLQLGLEVTKINGGLTAKATIEYTGGWSKKIKYTLLLIGPEIESPVDTAKIIAPSLNHSREQIQYTNDIKKLYSDNAIYNGDGRALIPLPFFFSENIKIEDEKLGYKTFIDLDKLKGTATSVGPLSIRFFVFPSDKRLHRSTQDLFIP